MRSAASERFKCDGEPKILSASQTSPFLVGQQQSGTSAYGHILPLRYAALSDASVSMLSATEVTLQQLGI